MVRPGMATVFHLIGYPGTGKYTIAQAMREQLEGAGKPGRVVDNHHVNNVVFHLLEPGARLPQEAWARTGEVWDAVLKTMGTLSPPGWWFIVTNYLAEDKGDERWMNRVAAMALRRGSEYVPVRLVCERGELLRRVVDPARRTRHKLTDPGQLTHLLDSAGLLTPAAERTLNLDVTDLSPEAAAQRIIAHAAASAR